MSKTLRTLAAAAVMAIGLPQMASAALVTKKLDFDLNIGGPDTALTTQYNDDAHGNAVFSGPNAFYGDFSVAHPGLPAGPTGVLFNGCSLANCTGSLITLTVNSLFQGTLDFWVWTRSSTGQIDVKVASGGDTANNINQTIPLINNGATSPNSWQHISINLAANTLYSTIQFQILAGNAYIDDISFQVDAGTTNVPEPASMALVALGLAGAAAATRRRKS